MNRKLEIFESVLTSPFNNSSFVGFVREFLNNVELIAPTKYNKEYSNFSFYVDGYYHIGNYISDDNDKIAIFSVCLNRGDTVERARSMQRNFVKPLIEKGGCAGALVAFFTKDEPDKWRLSFIRMDYEFSMGKVKEKLTPAKRYSYLVGKGEPCHTAKQRLYPIFMDDNTNPGIDELEEAFSVEKVTNEFFNLYKEKYIQLKEYLESNEEFMNEAAYRNFTSEQFAKKLMGQIVFLYFIQKKGWLGVEAIPVTMTEKQYKNAFFARGTKSRELVPKVYAQQPDGTYRIVFSELQALSDEDEEFLAGIVKGKPWGSGPKDFMRKIFDGCIDAGKNFFDDYLEPLFYTGLNKNRGENGFYAPLHRRIPFLNGGLFEQLDNYEWENNNFNIPNELFSNKAEKGRDADGILDIFDRYNFTMNEDEPMEREVAIDPEMLGKVFENLLDVKDRKSKGAFYTPREIVHYMCQETLINHLITKTELPESDVRDFILYGDLMKDEDTTKEAREGNKEMLISSRIYAPKAGINRLKELDDILANVKVADLAVGSGAFPLGMLNEIVKARETLSAYMAIGMNNFQKKSFYAYDRKPYDLKVNTIKNCIFACDLEPSAVDIAKLRLWLSIVIDDEITEEAGNGEFDAHTKPRQLPNLECNIICGNSLVDAFEGIYLMTENDALNNIGIDSQRALNQYTLEPSVRRIIELQDKLFFVKDHNEKEDIKAQIHSIFDEIVEYQLGSEDVIERYRNVKNAPSKPFILWQLEFPRVFYENGGFDIVIGNPPYIGERKHKDAFLAVQSGSLSKYYLGRMDFFYFFFHLALDLLKKDGICSLITTNYFTTALGGKLLRTDLKQRADIVELVNFNESKVFNSAAGQHNMITMFKKGKNDKLAKTILSNVDGALTPNEIEAILHEGAGAIVNIINQTDLYDGEENYIRILGVKNEDVPINAVLDKIVQESTDLLGNVCKPLIGLESSLDDVFVVTREKALDITSGDKRELENIKMFFKGSAIHRYEVEETSDKYILYLHEQIADIESYKGIWQYLLENETAIKGRKGANLRGAYRRGNWWVLNTPRLDMNFNDEKIVTPYRSKELRFALSTTPWYASRDVYYIVKNKPNISLKYILALLNSSLYYQWFFNRGKRKGDMMELYAKPLKEVPIKEISMDKQQPFIEVVDNIISMKKDGINTDELERKLDTMIYQLYNLNDEEIQLIEKEKYRYGRY